MKEEKRGFWIGAGVRLQMYGDIFRQLLRNVTRR